MTQPDDGKPEEKDPPDPAKTQGLRATRKAVAAQKKAAKKETEQSNVRAINSGKSAPAKKAPTKKAAAKKAEPPVKVVQNKDNPWYSRKSYTPVPGQKLYEATGESGQIAVRSCATEMTHAISWAQERPGERSQAIRNGTIFNFYPSEDAAKKAADNLRAKNDGDRIVVVSARPYKGQPGDKK
jgi:hypothetical protein